MDLWTIRYTGFEINLFTGGGGLKSWRPLTPFPPYALAPRRHIGAERQHKMLEYVHAFKHVPLWYWVIGAVLAAAIALMVLPKSRTRFDRAWRRRTKSFHNRSLREYTGSTNGWVKE